MKEIWKKITGFENYEVSNLGRIRNKKKVILNPWNDSHGYNDVKLYKDKKSFHRKVHRLVAIAFIPNPENKKQVNHKDGNTTNNIVNNLEWSTPKENINHLKKIKGISNQFTKFPKVAQYDLDGKLIKTFKTPTEAAKELGFVNYKGKNDARDINDCCKGNKKSYKGFMFKYFKDKAEKQIDKYIKKVRTGEKIEAHNTITKEQFLFNSIIEASRSLGIDKSCIYDVLKGKKKSTKNFSFKRTK